MEEESVIKEKQGSYITGIIGAIIGGAIATIPWVLAYVYGGMMLSILAALIAAGEFYGYKLAKGKISKKLPIILMVLAIVIVTITTLIIIPGLLIQKEGIAVSMDNIDRLYSNEEFATAIMKDFVISVIFTILGASIITSNIKKQLENSDGKEIKIEFNNTEELTKMKKDAIELIKPIFTKYEATIAEKAMMKEEVLAEIEDAKAKQSFNYLKRLGIIKKYKGKFYYSENDEDKQVNPKKIPRWKVILLASIIIILIAITVIATIPEENITSTTIPYQDGSVQFELGKDWNTTESEYETEWNFYKYINTVPVLDSENTITEDDYSSYPAGINVYYNQADTELIKSIDDIKTKLNASFESAEVKPDTLDMNISKTSKNYDMLKAKIVYSSNPQEVLYYYYILNSDKLACITAYSFNMDDDEAIEKETDKLVETFEWIQQ